MSTITELLAEIGRRRTGNSFNLDGNGVCRIAFDEERTVDIEPVDGSDNVHLYSSLAPLPAWEAETVYGKLLTANLFGAATAGAWFAIDPILERIVLNRTLDTASLDADGFAAILESFMDQIVRWSEELSSHRFAAPAESATGTGGSEGLLSAGEPLLIIRG